MNAGATGAAAAAAALANAVKAMGTIVQVLPADFERLLLQQDSPLVVQAAGGFFTTKYRYLFSHKGLAFYTEVTQPLNLPRNVDVVVAQKIWIPG